MSLPGELGLSALTVGYARLPQTAAQAQAQADDRDGSRELSEKQLAWQRAMEQAESPPWAATPPARTAGTATRSTGTQSGATEKSLFSNAGRRLFTGSDESGLAASQGNAATGTFVSTAGVPAAAPLPGLAEPMLLRTLSSESYPASRSETIPPYTSTAAMPPVSALMTKLAAWLSARMASADKPHSEALFGDEQQAASTTQSPGPQRVVVGADGKSAWTTGAGMRLHAEWSGDGVMIWLGADRPDLPAVAPLLDQLQHWLAGQGVRLLGVVCNGRTVLARRQTSAGDERQRAGSDEVFAAPAPLSYLKELT